MTPMPIIGATALSGACMPTLWTSFPAATVAASHHQTEESCICRVAFWTSAKSTRRELLGQVLLGYNV